MGRPGGGAVRKRPWADMRLAAEDVVRGAREALDAYIAARLVWLEARVREAVAASGEEDEDAIDRPPEPGPWRRLTVEEVIELDRAQLERWRDRTLAGMRRAFDEEWPTLPQHDRI